MIFIVGMPRSGTSLTEQILSSLSMVFGAGEVSTPKYIAGRLIDGHKHVDAVPRLSPVELNWARKEYMRRLPEESRGFQRVTDKMPANYLNVGLLHVIFPQATFVHCLRHPLDTILSCYFQNFNRHNSYCFDLEHLARHWLGMERVMAHWHKLLPGRIFTLNYEQLVTDREPVITALLEHCGLPWEEAALNPERNTRTVNTMSNWQVRKPIYSSAMGRWRLYRRHLQPVIDILDRDFDD